VCLSLNLHVQDVKDAATDLINRHPDIGDALFKYLADQSSSRTRVIDLSNFVILFVKHAPSNISPPPPLQGQTPCCNHHQKRSKPRRAIGTAIWSVPFYPVDHFHFLRVSLCLHKSIYSSRSSSTHNKYCWIGGDDCVGIADSTLIVR
jgi:hypothetical protein